MSNGNGDYIFAGHAIGAAAQFHRLETLTNLKHATPTLGASVLAKTGGRSEAHVDPYRFDVDQPRRWCLFAVDRIDTWVEGHRTSGGVETELSVEVDGMRVLEKLRVDALRLHMLAARTGSGDPVITTRGNRIEGMRLGNVEARVTFDDEVLSNSGTADQFSAWHRNRGRQFRQGAEYHHSSLVRDIQLVGAEKDKTGMRVLDNVIVWEGFGRIILGEIHVKGHERRLTLLRLAMGSNGAGTSTSGDGHTNGTGTTG